MGSFQVYLNSMTILERQSEGYFKFLTLRLGVKNIFYSMILRSRQI